MLALHRFVCVCFSTAILLLVFPLNAIAAASKPNVLIILADDLGYSDLGCYGGEIETPHLDSLAAGGLRFSQFYNTGRCWPTRGSLLTGYYAQQIRRDKLSGIKKSGARGKRPAWAPLLPKLLRPAGYRSYHSGKWHVDGMPISEGFDRSYYLKDQGRFFSPRIHWRDDKPLPAVPRGTDYYATDAITDHAIEVLREHAERHADRPFFHYLAYTAPHFPLHALPEDIEKYKERYSLGWEELRTQRWRKIQDLGLVKASLSEVERDQGAPYEFPKQVAAYGDGEVAKPRPWATLTDEQKEFQATKMAIHAAMIDRMDQGIGRVLQQLREMACFDNTLVLFLSDNGCSAELMIRADGHNVEAAMGSGATHLCLGPGWSTMCNTPFRKHKTWVHEGGISTPFIAHWPSKIKASGELRHNPAHVIDIVPTVLELAGIKQQPLPKAPDPPGKSLLPVFKEDGTVTHDFLWWYHDNHKAIRIGDWKAVKTAKSKWEFYNLSINRTERKIARNRDEKAVEEFSKRTGELVLQWRVIENFFTDIAQQDLEPNKK